MPKSLRDIIKNNPDLFEIRIIKPDRSDRTTWKFMMIDPRWGDQPFDVHKFRMVQLRRGDSFFWAYKADGLNGYFVDVRRAMHRGSVTAFVNNLIGYSVFSNDISYGKNDPSFRVTKDEMKNYKIDNFLDLCYHYKDYTAIGTGLTRNLRNLIVLDIDVNCTKPEIKEELNNLLLMFAIRNSLPDFFIYNTNTTHVQLQWLIQNYHYKTICEETKESIIKELTTDNIKNKEVDFRGIDFTKITDAGGIYRMYTRALCDISKRRKFGDKNYTFWKAKNPMSALAGVDGLELRVPYYQDGEIKYHSKEWMMDMFSTKEARQMYSEESPNLYEWYRNIQDILEPIVKNLSVKKVMKVVDADDVTEVKKKAIKPKKDDDASRNDFVLNQTRRITIETLHGYGIRKPEHLKRLSKEEFDTLKQSVYDLVRMSYYEEDKKYSGNWPGTTNHSPYSIDEFNKTFNCAFNWTTNKINDCKYTDDDRTKSLEKRVEKKEMRMSVVNEVIQQNGKMKRIDILNEVNEILKSKHQKPISMGSLKRYLSESKKEMA